MSLLVLFAVVLLAISAIANSAVVYLSYKFFGTDFCTMDLIAVLTVVGSVAGIIALVS